MYLINWANQIDIKSLLIFYSLKRLLNHSIYLYFISYPKKEDNQIKQENPTHRRDAGETNPKANPSSVSHGWSQAAPKRANELFNVHHNGSEKPRSSDLSLISISSLSTCLFSFFFYVVCFSLSFTLHRQNETKINLTR